MDWIRTLLTSLFALIPAAIEAFLGVFRAWTPMLLLAPTGCLLVT